VCDKVGGRVRVDDDEEDCSINRTGSGERNCPLFWFHKRERDRESRKRTFFFNGKEIRPLPVKTVYFCLS
jgi:hypothetical protein